MKLNENAMAQPKTGGDLIAIAREMLTAIKTIRAAFESAGNTCKFQHALKQAV